MGLFCTDTYAASLPVNQPAVRKIYFQGVEFLFTCAKCDNYPQKTWCLASSWSGHAMSWQWAQGFAKFCGWVCSQPEKALIRRNALICGMHKCSVYISIQSKIPFLCSIVNIENAAFRRHIRYLGNLHFPGVFDSHCAALVLRPL